MRATLRAPLILLLAAGAVSGCSRNNLPSSLGSSGTSLTIVLAAAYAGSIAGPALVGTTADHLGLRVALTILLAAAIVVTALAGNLQGADQPTPAPSHR